MNRDELKAALLKDRRESYARLRGGWPIPLAGAIYWAALAVLGHVLPLGTWAFYAFVTSGLIFPMALILGKIARIPFMQDKRAADDVLLPTFISMLLFWVFIVASAQEAPELVPLILAVGMSLHWPVIGWSYGRTGLFSAHAIIRAIGALLIWLYWPDGRITVLPAWVALIYVLTVIAIYFDSGKIAKRMT